jgi:hypothetical protein
MHYNNELAGRLAETNLRCLHSTYLIYLDDDRCMLQQMLLIR